MTKTDKLIRFLSSRSFFTIILIFFIAESLWLVFSAVYPMAFDEAFHFSIIQIYSHQFSPFFKSQPAGAQQLSALVRDPSYLYHYLMSFPLRLVAHFTSFQTTQVIWLRLINVGLLSWAFVVFRRVLIRLKMPSALANMSLLILALVPIVPLLAATINYDNLMILFIAYIFLNMIDVIKAAKARDVALKPLLIVAILCLFTSITQFSFLPIFAATVAFLVILYWHVFKHKVGRFWHYTVRSFHSLKWVTKYSLLILLILGMALVYKSYGVNTIEYKTPVPSCIKVLPLSYCENYGPWERNQVDHATKGTFKPSPIRFTVSWFVGMWYRSFFAINGDTPINTYQNFGPLPIIGFSAIVMVLSGIVLTIVYWRKIFKGNLMAVYFTAITLTYIILLFYKNFKAYVYTGQVVAVNGRYLIPLLVPMAYVFGLAFQKALAGLKRSRGLFVATSAIALILFLEGGGVFAFMVNSNETWYWSNSAVIRANVDANHITNHLIYGRNVIPLLH